MKLLIHHQGGDSFRGVVQRRLVFETHTNFSSSSADDALWTSEVLDQRTSAELIDWIDSFSHELSEKYPHIGLTLPFLLRQALINHGFPVDGVVDYPANW